jgi:hypothetical protein
LHSRDPGNHCADDLDVRSCNKASEMNRNSLLTKVGAFDHFIHNRHKNESRSVGNPRHHAALLSNPLNKRILMPVQFLIAEQKTL